MTKWITKAVILSVLFKVLHLVISMTFNRLEFSCVFVRLASIEVVSIVDSVWFGKSQLTSVVISLN